MEMSGPPHAPAALRPLNRRQGGPQGRCGCFGEEKNFLPLSGFEPSDLLARSLVSVLTRLSRLPK